MTVPDSAALARFSKVQVIGPRLYHLLRGRIVRGELAPGIRLSEMDVAAGYGVSRQPVREAFIKLAEEALVEVRPQRGTFVSRIRVPAVMSARFVREAVEADIVRLVARRADAEVLADLDALIEAQRAAADVPDPQPFMALDERFHRRLAASAGQAAGWDILEPLKTQMDRVRYLSARQFPRRQLVDQHVVLVAAIRAGDADRAEAVMREHLRQLLDDLPAVAAALPGFFEAEPGAGR